jgi:predicted DNA-binding transcriptional regulator AlpA
LRSSGWSRTRTSRSRSTLDKLGVSRPTFYRWYDRYTGGSARQGWKTGAAAWPRLEPHPGAGP